MSSGHLFDSLQTALRPSLELDRELGGGGMSRVFVATDPSLERPVVVKVLPPERSATLSAERFRREILIAARLQHPNIVPVLAAGAAEGVLWYSMPFVAGASLRHRLSESGALDATAAIPILRDVARALAYAHKQGIVHRDVKPDNILLSEDGAATVTDFGIAKALDTARTGESHSSLTQAGNSIGTPHYMAPEQIAGDPDIDGRVDLYAFGVVAYEMLAGRTPFHGRPNSQVLTAHLAESPAPLSTLVPGVPTALADLVFRCLEKDPAARPGSDELVRLLEGASTTGSVPSVARSRTKRLTLIGVSVTLVAAALLATWQWRKPTEKPLDPAVLAVAPFRIVDRGRDLDWLREGMLDLLSAKLTGEGGIRATAPRAMLAEWQLLRAKSAADAEFEPSLDDSRAAARALGAGRLLLGEIIPGAEGIELIATVFDAAKGDEVGRFRIAGPRDSVVTLVDRLGGQLLTALSGEQTRRSTPLTHVSLEALRPYLEGQSLLRRLRAEDATAAFMQALAADSTFALAGIGAVMSSSWYGAQTERLRAMEIAFRHRDQLSPRDAALLGALTGPRYPANPSTAELYQAKLKFLALAPDSPEAWYLVGDHHYHFGAALGLPNWRREASRHFRRALALDSSYVPGYAHLIELAATERDDSLFALIQTMRQRQGETPFQGLTARWHRAASKGDTAGMAAVERELLPQQTGFAFTFADYAATDGHGFGRALAHLERITPAAGDPVTRRNMYRLLGHLLYVAGAPAAGVTALEASAAVPDDPFVLATIVRAALVGDGDTLTARRAVERLLPWDQAPIEGVDSVSGRRREATRAVALWRLMRGDTSSAARDLARLRSPAAMNIAAGVPGSAPTDAHLEALEALRAVRRGDTLAMRRTRQALHEALGALDWGSARPERAVAIALVSARLHQEAGEWDRALIDAGRAQLRNGGVLHPYTAVQARLVAALAERQGDKATAEEAKGRLREYAVRTERGRR